MPSLCKQGVRGSSPLGSTISPCQRPFRHPKKLSKAQVQQQSTATVREQVMMLAVVFEPLADAFSAGKSSRWSLGCMHPSVTAIWLWRSICMLGTSAQTSAGSVPAPSPPASAPPGSSCPTWATPLAVRPPARTPPLVSEGVDVGDRSPQAVSMVARSSRTRRRSRSGVKRGRSKQPTLP
jgi:hypothetical protein